MISMLKMKNGLTIISEISSKDECTYSLFKPYIVFESSNEIGATWTLIPLLAMSKDQICEMQKSDIFIGPIEPIEEVVMYYNQAVKFNDLYEIPKMKEYIKETAKSISSNIAEREFQKISIFDGIDSINKKLSDLFLYQLPPASYEIH